ncbi:hypothetical protein ABDI28_07755, partial [Peribacillus frigoritolerans]|uniref:hypothetical protein n=1 Tax=Peribacillus frigoritolerans TaxID=450367 RepID=UPI003D276FB6
NLNFTPPQKNCGQKDFYLLKHKVDWNGRYETPAEKAWQGRPHRLKERRGAPGTPAESECLKWKSKFYTASKNCGQKDFYLLKQS